MSCITLKEMGGDLVVDVDQESTVIGRGQFLQITDKRVSRSHALLELKDRKLYITPTHTNPCFLRTETSKEQTVLTRDVKHMLSDGDEFGLLPDQLFYKVHYPQLNGKESETEKETGDQANAKVEKIKEDTTKPDIISNGGSEATKNDGPDLKEDKKETEAAEVKAAPEKKETTDVKEESSSEKPETKSEKEDDKDEEEEEEEEETNDKEKEDMAMPVDKKRVLPAWMVKAANQESPVKAKTSPKKPISEAVSKRLPGTKLTKPDPDEDDEDFEEEIEDDDDDEEEYKPQKRGRGRLSKLSDDDYEEEASDDDYTPEKPSPRNQRGRGRKKKKASDSEDDDFSDEDDDYSPRKSKTKKTPKGKAKKKTPSKRGPARTARTVTPRSRTKRKLDDDDEYDDDILPRRRGGPIDDDDGPSRRPQRAAKQKRGSYVDDPLIEEALEDFASEEEVVEDKDSDFDVDGIEDSGSDWEKTASNSQKQKAAKVRGRAAAKPVSRRGPAKKKGRRPSKPRDSDDDDDEDDDIMEDDEPYVPRPSKRRGGLLSQDTEESDEDGHKKRRKRETCQYGKKCYRKNPVHFRTFCHPGDSSYDEEDKDDSSAKEKKERDSGKASPAKPSRPQRSTAGTKLVTHGADDDDLPDTYDYQDSFIDDGTQPSEGEAEGEDDSDYDAEEDIRGLAKEAKTFVRGKKK